MVNAKRQASIRQIEIQRQRIDRDKLVLVIKNSKLALWAYGYTIVGLLFFKLLGLFFLMLCITSGLKLDSPHKIGKIDDTKKV